MQYKKVENLVIYKGEQDYTYSTLLNLLILLKSSVLLQGHITKTPRKNP